MKKTIITIIIIALFALLVAAYLQTAKRPAAPETVPSQQDGIPSSRGPAGPPKISAPSYPKPQ